MSLWGSITGADSAKKAGKKAAKGQKKAQATYRNEYLPKTEALRAEQRADIAASEAKAAGAVSGAGANQQKALAQASANQQNVLAQNQRQQEALFNPYLQYGQGGTQLMQGAFGESPEAATAFMERFKNSPLYGAMIQPALEQSQAALSRMGAARGGLNSGGLIRDIMSEAGDIGNRGMMDYMGLLQNRLGFGAGMAGQASSAYGQNALGRASAYGNTGQLQSSAYGQTGQNLANVYGNSAQQNLQSGALYSGNLGTGYGGIANAQIGQGNAQAAGYMGAANSQGQFMNGAMNALGTAVGGSSKPWFLS